LLLCTAAIGCKTRPDVQVLGECSRLDQSAPSPRRSPLFDGARVRLLAARGATLGITVRISDARKRVLQLVVDPSAATVQAFRGRLVRVSEPSTSMYGRAQGPASTPMS
jgi:hypothetical protein